MFFEASIFNKYFKAKNWNLFERPHFLETLLIKHLNARKVNNYCRIEIESLWSLKITLKLRVRFNNTYFNFQKHVILYFTLILRPNINYSEEDRGFWVQKSWNFRDYLKRLSVWFIITLKNLGLSKVCDNLNYKWRIYFFRAFWNIKMQLTRQCTKNSCSSAKFICKIENALNIRMIIIVIAIQQSYSLGKNIL